MTEATDNVSEQGAVANASPVESKHQQGSESTKLDTLLYQLIADVQEEQTHYIENQGRLIKRPIEARIRPILEWSRQEAVQARIEEVESFVTTAYQLHENPTYPKRIETFMEARLMELKAEVTDPASEPQTEARTSSELQSPQEVSDV